MFLPVDTKDPTAVEVEVQTAYLELFPSGDRLFVPRVFGWAIECFTGNYRNYGPIDARYHDLEHTLQGTLCMARLLRARRRAGARPELTQRAFELGILAILLHDTGYLRTRDDTLGTGAKYTATHVGRSADFAALLLAEKGFGATDIQAVQHMIRCTGVNVALATIPFRDDLERAVGYTLGTADYLGQMAAPDYVDKLPILFAEFAEAEAFSGKLAIGGFTSAEELLRRTPAFWERFVLPKLTEDYGGLFRFLADPYPAGPNYYVQRVEANIANARARGQPR